MWPSSPMLSPKKKTGFFNGIRESISKSASVMISRKVLMLTLEIFTLRSFDLSVVTGAVLCNTKVRLRSAPPTCPKWHFLERGLEEYRTAKENNTWSEIWKKMIKYLQFKRRNESRRGNHQHLHPEPKIARLAWSPAFWKSKTYEKSLSIWTQTQDSGGLASDFKRRKSHLRLNLSHLEIF